MTEGDSRRERTRFVASEVRAMLLLLVFGELAGIGAASWTRHTNPELSKLFATAATTLLFGSLLGGVVTLLITDFDRRRVQRAARLDFIANVLTDLKGVHDQVDRGRTLIKAHQSAKTYGEEMRGFIEARVKLQNVERALRTDERRGPILPVRKDVLRIDGYLRVLLEEYEQEYEAVSLKQSIFEAQLKRVLERPPQDCSVDALPRNVPWGDLERLPRLADFLLRSRPLSVAAGRTQARTCKAFLGRSTQPQSSCVPRWRLNYRRNSSLTALDIIGAPARWRSCPVLR